MINALFELRQLGAIDDQQRITKLGRKMAVLPIEPKLGRILLASFELGCPSEIVSLVALLGFADTLLFSPSTEREEAIEAHSKFVHRDGDPLTLLNMLRSYEAVPGNKAERKAWCKDNYVNAKALANALEARKQLRERCDRMGLEWKQSCGDETEPILQSCLMGLGQNTAVLCPDGTYRRLLGSLVSSSPFRIRCKLLISELQNLKIHPSSVLHQKRAPAILFWELVRTLWIALPIALLIRL